MIQLKVNNSIHQMSQETNLANLLAELDIDALGCAIAVDDQIVPRTEWPTFTVKENMSINIFQAIAGG